MFKPRNLPQSQTLPALPLQLAYAKTREAPNGETVLGQTVFVHCRTVGLVARAISVYLPEKLRSRWLSEPAITAALHDVGKVSPSFQEKLRRHTDGYTRGSTPELARAAPELEHEWGGHAGVSYLAVKDHPQGSQELAQVAGAHHGYMPSVGVFKEGLPIFGGEPWKERRRQLIDKLIESLGQKPPHFTDPLQVRVMAGLTSVADWIGSGSTLSSVNEPTREDVQTVTRECGFRQIPIKTGKSFQEIFGFAPNETQKAFAQSIRGPGVYVLEAEMGAGKTEAALYAAYLALCRGDATGFYFALPTQATSDSIYSRVKAFMNAVAGEEAGVRLAHSNAFFTEMGADAAPSGDFFSPAKRRLLYPFGVGTIDQALMAVMSVKHGAVRTFGLLGKVLILDEVHTYDLYTGSLMDELIGVVRRLGGIVILLSATLTKTRREALLKVPVSSNAYPLLTSVCEDASEAAIEQPIASVRRKDIEIIHCRCDDDAFAEAFERSRKGQQILWIENSVRQAQDAYRHFCRLAGEQKAEVEIGLLHARFTRGDRRLLEEKWIGLYGRKARTSMPRQGRILIGTQVLEQALDLDSDFLVTRFCPTDLLLQRLGRLWRHPGSVRVEGTRCQAMILEPDLVHALEDPEATLGTTGNVYVPYVLIKSLQAWKDRTVCHLPDDIRPLIEATYETSDESTALVRLHSQMIAGYRFRGIVYRGTESMRSMAAVAMSGSLQRPDDEACTRLIEVPSAEVLVIREWEKDSVTLWDGAKVDLPIKLSDRVKTALDLRRNQVSVPEYLAPAALDKEKTALLSEVIPGAGSVRVLNLQAQKQTLRSNRQTSLPDYNAQLGYFDTKGLQPPKTREQDL